MFQATYHPGRRWALKFMLRSPKYMKTTFSQLARANSEMIPRSMPSALQIVLKKRTYSIYAIPCIENHYKQQHNARQIYKCLATSWDVIRPQPTIWKRIRNWIRTILHLWKLLSLGTPLVLSAPLVVLTRAKWLEERWWQYAEWAARYSSPAVMKFLQWASTRRDMFSAEFCNRFESFHTQAPEHSWSETEEALILALGQNWQEIVEIDKNPVGSGCMAQVYRGRLLNPKYHNQEVAVKVIHPDVQRLVELDLDLLSKLVALLEHVSKVSWLGARESVNAFSTLMAEQIDMRTEAQNLQQFSKNFRTRKQAMQFPEPIMELSNENVLVETFEYGRHFHEIDWETDPNLSKQRKKEMARIMLDSYLRMVFLDNFAHGDLHPGNLLFNIDLDSQKGERNQSKNATIRSSVPNINGIVVIDAGIVTRLEREDMQNFVELFHAVVTGNGYKAGELIIARSKPRQGEDVPKCKDKHTFCSAIENIVTRSLRSLRLEQVHVASLLREVMELCCTHEVQLQGKYSSILVSVAILEAVGRRLDPELDLLPIALPIVGRAMVINSWK